MTVLCELKGSFRIALSLPTASPFAVMRGDGDDVPLLPFSFDLMEQVSRMSTATTIQGLLDIVKDNDLAHLCRVAEALDYLGLQRLQLMTVRIATLRAMGVPLREDYVGMAVFSQQGMPVQEVESALTWVFSGNLLTAVDFCYCCGTALIHPDSLACGMGPYCSGRRARALGARGVKRLQAEAACADSEAKRERLETQPSIEHFFRSSKPSA